MLTKKKYAKKIETTIKTRHKKAAATLASTAALTYTQRIEGQQQMNDLQVQRYVHSEPLILLKAAAMRKPSKFSRFISALVRAFTTSGKVV